ncbi:ArsR/SmtB family transcription factor [Amycolatopsis azurea]|uniref:ArsR/SmtB family transcription factor n=1 Tax=Amycolatopsis azurea TaxID=36819 RepID=UPI0038031C32
MTGSGPVEDDAGKADLGTVFRALADEHRRTVIAELAADVSDRERTCNSFALPVSKQTQTHHFRVLREAGLIHEINYGNRKGIRLRRAEINRWLPGLLDLLTAERRDAGADGGTGM